MDEEVRCLTVGVQGGGVWSSVVRTWTEGDGEQCSCVVPGSQDCRRFSLFFSTAPPVSQIIFSEWVFPLYTEEEKLSKEEKEENHTLVVASHKCVDQCKMGKSQDTRRVPSPWLCLIHLLRTADCFLERSEEEGRPWPLAGAFISIFSGGCQLPLAPSSDPPASPFRRWFFLRLLASGQWLKSSFHKQFVKWFGVFQGHYRVLGVNPDDRPSSGCLQTDHRVWRGLHSAQRTGPILPWFRED